MIYLAQLAVGLALLAFYQPSAARGQTTSADLSQADADNQNYNNPSRGSISLERVIQFKPQGYNEQAGLGLPAGMVIPTTQGNLRLEFQNKASPLPSYHPLEMPRVSERQLGLLLAVFSGFYLLMTFFPVRQKAATRAQAGNREGEWPDNFTLARIIGKGGMGVVYEATDRALDRKVALKRMRDELTENSAELEQFLKEAKTVANLHHPNIVAIHSIVRQGEHVFLVFEFVEGKTVDALLRELGHFTLPQARSVVGQVCQALDFAHSRQVIHRDLKPSNIMVTAGGIVKVMDFGIARRIKDAAAKSSPKNAIPEVTNKIVGTPLYMGPEAEQGLVCPEGDIYALGVILYELLSGVTPFPPPAEALQKIARGYLPLSRRISGLPSEIDRLIDDALEPEPGKRIHTPREFWWRLSSIIPI